MGTTIKPDHRKHSRTHQPPCNILKKTAPTNPSTTTTFRTLATSSSPGLQNYLLHIWDRTNLTFLPAYNVITKAFATEISQEHIGLNEPASSPSRNQSTSNKTKINTTT